MMRFLYHDLIVAGNFCNLRCSYCTAVDDANDYGTETSASARRRGATTDIAGVLDLVDALRRGSDAPVLKVSGGELFLLSNIVELIEALAQRYAYVQVLTNGTELTTAAIARIAGLGNVGFNLSLDGHRLDMNLARWTSPKLHHRVIDAFYGILATGRELEVTSVISEANADRYVAFLEYLEDTGGDIVAIPIPVRGINASRAFAAPLRSAFAQTLRRIAWAHPAVLGPAAYYERFADFLDQDNSLRNRRCHIVDNAIQLFDTGTVTPCPVGWTVSIGNLKTEGIDAVMAQVGSHKIYDLLTRDVPRVPVCRTCFTQSDIINLFMEGCIDLDGMRRMPMYRTSAAQRRLDELRMAQIGSDRAARPPDAKH